MLVGMVKMRLETLACFVGLLLVVGCGDDDDGTSDASTTQDGGGTESDSGVSTDGGPVTDASRDGGGSVGECSDPGNGCTMCVIDEAPSVEAECTCLGCPTFPTTTRECGARNAQYAEVCADWMRRVRCPIPVCIAPPPVNCVDGRCETGSRL